MSIKVEKTENKNELKLTFNVPAEVFDEGMKKVYAKTSKYFTVPGFRKGKAPMAMVERTYGSKIFYEDTFNEIAPEIYIKEIKENNIEVVNKPDVVIEQIGKGKELIFTAIVQVKPEVKLGEYKGIELEKNEHKIMAEDVNKELTRMAKKNARLITIENKPVAQKDIAVIDFEGFVDGVPFNGGKGENYELEIGSQTFIPGFEDQIVGMKVDQEKDISVKFPEEYFAKDLAGKDAIFKVKLHEIKRRELPKIDDEFAKDVSEFDTIKELKASVKEKLVEASASKAKFDLEEQAIKVVSDNAEVEIPSGMIDKEIDDILKDIESKLAYQGVDMKKYVETLGKTEGEMRKDYEESATASVKSRLVLGEIAKAEGLEPTEEEMTEKLKEFAEKYGRDYEDIKDNEDINNYIKINTTNKKVIDFIVENAKIK